MNQLLGGGKQLLPSEVRTFLSVDFYTHESKQSDRFTGFQPVINTLFSFKNRIDDFYANYIDTEFMNVDVLALTPQDRVVQLGYATIHL